VFPDPPEAANGTVLVDEPEQPAASPTATPAAASIRKIRIFIENLSFVERVKVGRVLLSPLAFS
jgi:hypothetical protein